MHISLFSRFICVRLCEQTLSRSCTVRKSTYLDINGLLRHWMSAHYTYRRSQQYLSPDDSAVYTWRCLLRTYKTIVCKHFTESKSETDTYAYYCQFAYTRSAVSKMHNKAIHNLDNFWRCTLRLRAASQ